MFCRYCGNEMNVTDKFCHICGKKNEGFQKEGEETEKKKQGGHNHKKKRWILPILILLFSASAIGGICYYRMNSGYDPLLKKWFRAMETADIDLYEEVYAEQWFDYEARLRQKNFRDYLSQQQQILEGDLERFEDYCGSDPHYTYQVTEEKEYSEEELNELAEALTELDIIRDNDEVKEAVRVSGTYTVSGDIDVVSDSFYTTCIKINGEWKMLGLIVYGYSDSGIARYLTGVSGLSLEWYKEL